MAEKLYCLINDHVQHLGNILSFITHFQRLAIITRTMTHLARHIDVRQKMHLDFDNAIAFARFAASAFDVKTETPRLIAAHFCLLGLAKDLTDNVKNAGVGGRVRTRRSPDGRLVNIDDLIHQLQTFHRLVRSRTMFAAVQSLRQTLIQNIIDQGAFARTGYPCHHRK